MKDDFFKNIDFTFNNPKCGKLLVSEPFLFDPFFKRTVILLVEHDEEGSVGFILNKSVNMQINDVIEGFPDFEAEIYFGGPVNQNNLFYLHTLGEALTDSKQVMKGLYWGGDYEHLKALIMSQEIKPNQIRFFAGYSGWDANQLEGELEQKSWIITKTNTQQVMHGTQMSLWNDVLKSMGKKFEIMSKFPDDPSLN